MTPAAPQPPRIAVWLVSLFAPEQQAEAISGDLLEEFSQLAARSSESTARRWYWRQSVKTAAHLIGSGFRESPWLIALAVTVGYLMLSFGLKLPARAAVTALQYHRGVVLLLDWSSYFPRFVSAVRFGQLLVCVIVGSAVAAIAKGREMLPVCTLAALYTALFADHCITWAARLAPGYAHVMPFMLASLLMWGFVQTITIIIGAAFVRNRRSASRRLVRTGA